MTVDLSRERRRLAVSMLKSERPRLQRLSFRPQLVYAVGLLIADGRGIVTEADVSAAAADPSVLQVASALLAKAGYPAEAVR